MRRAASTLVRLAWNGTCNSAREAAPLGRGRSPGRGRAIEGSRTPPAQTPTGARLAIARNEGLARRGGSDDDGGSPGCKGGGLKHLLRTDAATVRRLPAVGCRRCALG